MIAESPLEIQQTGTDKNHKFCKTEHKLQKCS